MEANSKISINKLKKNQFIEIFSLDDIDEGIFSNYQRYDFYQVIWFTSIGGDNRYFIDFNEYTIKENQVVVIFPGQIDRLDTQGKKGFLFAIHPDNFFNVTHLFNSPYLNGYFSNVFITLNNKTREITEKITGMMLSEYNDENRITLMEAYLGIFLFHVSQLFDKNNYKNKVDSQVSELMKLIDTYFIEERTTEFYAGKMNLTHKRLNEIVIRGTGKTVKQHLQERLVLEIKKEIRLQQKNLKEIAFDLGFSDPTYFTRFFKQQTSITPTKFRESSSL